MFIFIDTSSNLGTYKCTLPWKAIMWKVSSTQPGGDQLWTDQHLVGVCLFLRLISKKIKDSEQKLEALIRCLDRKWGGLAAAVWHFV